MIKLGVVGCGYWGSNIVRNFASLPDSELFMLSDLNSELLERMSCLYPNVKTTVNPDDIFTEPAIDGVAIMTPAADHFDLAQKALNAGKHVLVAKPITTNSLDAEKLVELAAKKDKILMVDHTFIYSAAIRKIRDLVDSNELGEINYYDSVRASLGPVKLDVNVMWDMLPHDFAIMSYLIDKIPTSITAIGAKTIKNDSYNLDSIAYVTIGFDEEVVAGVHASWVSPIKTRRLIIGGSKKMAIFDLLDNENQLHLYDRGVEVNQVENKMSVKYKIGDTHSPKLSQQETLQVMCQHFANCIKNGEKPMTDGYEGLKVVRLLEAAQRSIDSGGLTIKCS